MRKLLLSSFLATSCLFGAQALAVEPVAGTNYVVLESPVAVSKKDQIEVVELFWYGCPHCYQLEPTLNPWVEQLPEDVNFVKMPAMFGGAWDVHGQLFYTLQALKVEQKVHDRVFDALHNKKQRLANAKEIASFLEADGIDQDTFNKTWNSFGVKSQMEKARQQAMAYQVQGVPALVINGKYRFDIGMAGGLTETTELADALIAQERQATESEQE
ncbi:thiol:disulfide interchange protein [Thiopseudomonas alkaliphila]|uniref:Thiol:disulfide interchange protein n=2 Tax=Thiopseudomonas alkaliphila TaxID=1697053 RepID=A0A0K1XEL8_9GAMM|nr:thiol:disulfide interchange protein DsbA/DsbL [Thiopseudomonas alkaliphila]AKX47197.1 thiol:disulfide interchange protein [Thiopseudomonas alkaliphila]AKX48579.1 thiol:disulfide interchange protein [Thiopseudomonas alkaliphila]AKX53703.1 thiol:disulfide interchange protein [Thiopseudomonas alkaliphila]AKX59699.1 thiol:disulfide interchange protein [Thiopseudomonas alkaliphila]MDM1708686.1 thiol:disulfide interchange protein DsbA/DsbL [Thiopseudomonas alkaliphila]